MKTNIKGCKEYSREQIKIMKQMVQKIKVLNENVDQTEDINSYPNADRYIVVSLSVLIII